MLNNNMGEYLSKPDTTKTTEFGENQRVFFFYCLHILGFTACTMCIIGTYNTFRANTFAFHFSI